MRRAGLLGLCIVCACKGGSFVLSSAGASVRVVPSPFSLSVRDAGGREVLATLPGEGPGLTTDRSQWVDQILQGWSGFRSREDPWTRAAEAQVRSQSASAASLRLGDIDLDVSVDGARVRVAMKASSGNKLGVSFKLGAERFFGLGERLASVDHRGLSLYSWAEEGGLGAGENVAASATNPYPNGPSMTNFPVPFLLSSGGYAVRVEGSARSEFALGSERADAWRIAVLDTSMALDVYVHDDPLASLSDFTADVGRPPVPAPWVFGPRREVGVYDQVGGIPEWQALRNAGVATTALDDNLHFLPAHGELWQEDALRNWTSTLHAEGFKVLAYATPYVSTTAQAAAGDLADGIARDAFVKTRDGSLLKVFFSSGEPQTLATIDLTNPGGVAFFQGLLQRAVDLGYDGWMHDFGEYVTPAAVMHDGRDGLHAHNDFPLLSAKAAFELLEQQKPGDYLFFVRSGWAGSGAVVPAVWSGDPEATFDETQGLPAQLRAGVNLGMSGAPYWGSDIGGYKCLTDAPNDKEMYLRWAAFGAVSPLMMNDTACANPIDGTRPKWTLWSDAETTQAYAALAQLHTRLAPYFWTLAAQAHATGRPLMIHPWLLWPQRAEALAVDDWFYLGPALLAAPVVRRGLSAKHLWLPPGAYVDLRAPYTRYTGDATVDLPAPLGELPLLLVAGQILPLLDPGVMTLAPSTDAQVVTADSMATVLDAQVALAPGQSAQLTLSDGTQLSAERSADAATTLAAVDASLLPGCELCYVDEPGRLRVNSALARQSDVSVREVRLSAHGPSARRVRWDVFRTEAP